MMLIGRRVIKPLHVIRDAMLRVAGGDLTAEASFPGRKDEIGALAGALGTFKQNAEDKARIEAEQRERHAQAETRQATVNAASKPSSRGEDGARCTRHGVAADAGYLVRHEPCGRAQQGPGQGRGRRLGRSVQQCADRGGGVGGIERVDWRDQPPVSNAADIAGRASRRPARPTAPCRAWWKSPARSAR